jgi:hypothetical protein
MLEIIAAFVGEEIAGQILEVFKENVIKKWANFRAKIFFKTFLKEIQNINSSSDYKNINVILEKFLKDDKKAEFLYDVYRKVSLSASKEIGQK